MGNRMKFGSKEHCAELRKMREGADRWKDRSQDADWLRTKFLQASADLETAEKRIEELGAELNRECLWTLDDGWEGESWDTGCGEKWEFTNDGPKENNVKFCHGCGGRLAVK